MWFLLSVEFMLLNSSWWNAKSGVKEKRLWCIMWKKNAKGASTTIEMVVWKVALCTVYKHRRSD